MAQWVKSTEPAVPVEFNNIKFYKKLAPIWAK
jgi:hypothetical protein